MEVWKPVKGCEKYAVSDRGRVRNEATGYVSNGRNSGHGYKKVTFWLNNVAVATEYVHRLVADAFIPNPNGYKEVNHIDGDRTNNRVENLEWVTSSGNTEHAVETGALVPWNHKRTPIIATNIHTGESIYFKSMSLAERELGTRHINLVLRGDRKTAKGYTFRYASGGDADAT